MCYLADLILHLEQEDLLTDKLKEELISFDTHRNERFKKMEQDVEVCHIGKYKGKRFDDIVRYDRQWIEFVVAQPWLKPEQKQYIAALLDDNE